ncbi:hypothetical protein TNIN_229341 [Trichonephila inaurata madagascariensis]|uniref:Uncharacterized protein n=1 Tax=Trichonephila inaurata madagascariensis TaxID=2747483 RepID=A0A8X6YUN5_9ARAC|nr:hypothetical protein TNIN_229341 [Trichonephila inaurata madagascariensis]
MKQVRGCGNGLNMKGGNKGPEKPIPVSILVHHTYRVCETHALNCVVYDAASSSGEISVFFDKVQEAFNNFSASTYQWGLLNQTSKISTFKTIKCNKAGKWFI